MQPEVYVTLTSFSLYLYLTYFKTDRCMFACGRLKNCLVIQKRKAHIVISDSIIEYITGGTEKRTKTHRGMEA